VSVLDIFLIVAAIGIGAITTVLVPTLLQLKRTIHKTELFVETLNHDLAPLLRSLSQTSMELQILSTTLNDKLKRTDRIIDTIQHSSNTLLMATDMVKSTLLPIVTQVGGLSTGIKAIISFFKAAKGRN
jgi:uncharacterized protein YoxC